MEMARVDLVLRFRRIFSPCVVLFEFIVQRFQADTEKFGGAGFVLTGSAERLQYKFAFGGVNGGADRKANPSKSACSSGRVRVAEFVGQVLAGNDAAVGGDGGPLDDVAQFADVAGP